MPQMKNMVLPLPADLVSYIFSMDPTYHPTYKACMMELANKELGALLKCIKRPQRIQFDSDDEGWFEVTYHDGEKWEYLVVDPVVRYCLAWDSRLCAGIQYDSVWGQVCTAASIYGYPALLGCDWGYEQQVMYRGTHYFVYRRQMMC